MSNGAELINTMCSVAKLNATAASADRVLCLLWLQRAADTICAAADIRVPTDATVTLTQGTSVYQVNASPFPTDMIDVLDVVLTDLSVTAQPLQRVSMTRMRELRTGTVAQGSPYVYAVDYPQFMLFPAPGASASLAVSYSQDAPTLADSGTAITFIPKAFQWGCLYNYAMSEAMSYKKQPAESADFLQKFYNDRSAGLPALKRWKALSGGRQLPDQQRVVGAVRSSTSQDLGGV